MNNPNDGGPAFARTGTEFVQDQSGMSLRDYFAAQAMQAIVTKLPLKSIGATRRGAIRTNNADDRLDMQMVACGAYAYADAMLREKSGTAQRLWAKESVLVGACEELLAIIHDDLTHERQEAHADAISGARDAIAAAMRGAL